MAVPLHGLPSRALQPNPMSSPDSSFGSGFFFSSAAGVTASAALPPATGATATEAISPPPVVPHSTAMTSGSSTSRKVMKGDEGFVTSQADGSSLLSVTSGAASDAYFQGLVLIKTMVKLIPCWLQSNRLVLDTLVLIWKSPARISRLQNEQELNLVQVKESKWLVKCFLNYLRHDKNEVNVLL